jgi:hypothetical protein
VFNLLFQAVPAKFFESEFMELGFQQQPTAPGLAGEVVTPPLLSGGARICCEQVKRDHHSMRGEREEITDLFPESNRSLALW